MIKPNLFLIGAPKCGTTALANNLSQHPYIYLPSIKEPRYFDRSVFYDYEEDYITPTLKNYLKYYESKKAQKSKYLMDGSVFVMYDIRAIENILHMSSDAKFILILRDPVEASVSMFNQRLSYIDPKMREICDDFNRCWMLIEKRKKGEGYPKGCRNRFLFRYDLLYSYQLYLPEILNLLGNKIFIGFYDEYKNNFSNFMKKLLGFLNLEYIYIENKKINKSYTIQDSVLLKILENLSKSTIGIRKRIGLIGIGKYKQKLYSLFKRAPKKVAVLPEVYDFFKPTYKYMEELRKELESKNSK